MPEKKGRELFMKKFIALVLAMLLCCSCAFAEELPVFAFDPASVEGMDGGFVAIGDTGLQMYIPNEFVAFEPSENDVANGVLAIMGREDGSLMLTISMAGVADAEGNLITDLETLRDFYTANGAVGAEIVDLNGYMALSYGMEQPVPTNGIVVMFEGGIVVAFNVNFAEGTDENLNLTAIMLSSIMELVVE